MKHKQIFVTSLVIILVTTNIVLLVYTSWTNLLWKQEMYGMATYAATLQALSDFRAGELRLYELVEDGNHGFANRYDGSFEIWYKPYYSTLGGSQKYTQETFIEAYNRKMRYMYEHPEKFKPNP
jgi:hypothetical protein